MNDKGIPLNQQDDQGYSPIHHAVMTTVNHESTKILYNLLKNAAPTDLKDVYDQTPLDLANAMPEESKYIKEKVLKMLKQKKGSMQKVKSETPP